MNSIFCKSVALTKWTIGLTLSAALIACGGSGSDPVVERITVASADVATPINATTVAALVPAANAAPIVATFNSGFSGVDAAGVPVSINGATTVSFTSAGTPAAGAAPATLPKFRIDDNVGNTATGVVTFGSCIFTVGVSTFATTSPLAVGKVIKVDPCTLTVNTDGAKANGIATMHNWWLLLGSDRSITAAIPVMVERSGAVWIGSTSLGTVTTVSITGAGS